MEAGESKPSAAVGEGGQEGEVEGEGDHEKEEGKAEEKGNLAGERQSGDGQVRRFLCSSRSSSGQNPHGSVFFPWPGRNPRTTPRPRRQENRASSWTTTRTGKTPPTSPERGCSSSTMSEDPPRRMRGTAPGPVPRPPEPTAAAFPSAGPRGGTGSCGRTKADGSTTASGRRSKRPRAARSSSPSTATTSGTAPGPPTGSASPGGLTPRVWFFRLRPPLCFIYLLGLSAGKTRRRGGTNAGGRGRSDPPDPGRTGQEELRPHLSRPPPLSPLSLPLSATTPPEPPRPGTDPPTTVKLTPPLRPGTKTLLTGSGR